MQKLSVEFIIECPDRRRLCPLVPAEASGAVSPFQQQAFAASSGAATKADRRGQWGSNVHNITYIGMCSVM